MKRLTFLSTVLPVVVCAWLTRPAVAQHEHPAGDSAKLGRVNFPVSCAPSVQQEFGKAVAMLHSFWYEKANATFAAVAERSDLWNGVLGHCHDLLPSNLVGTWAGGPEGW